MASCKRKIAKLSSTLEKANKKAKQDADRHTSELNTKDDEIRDLQPILLSSEQPERRAIEKSLENFSTWIEKPEEKKIQEICRVLKVQDDFIQSYRIEHLEIYEASKLLNFVSTSPSVKSKMARSLLEAGFISKSTNVAFVCPTGRSRPKYVCPSILSFFYMINIISQSRAKGAKLLIRFSQILSYLSADPAVFNLALTKFISTK